MGHNKNDDDDDIVTIVSARQESYSISLSFGWADKKKRDNVRSHIVHEPGPAQSEPDGWCDQINLFQTRLLAEDLEASC